MRPQNTVDVRKIHTIVFRVFFYHFPSGENNFSSLVKIDISQFFRSFADLGI